MLQRKRIIYLKPFNGEIKINDLQLITDELSTELAENEILCEAEYIGIDAGVKMQALYYPHGITMIGAQIAKVIDSRNDKFPKGVYIYGKFGWQTHTVTNPDSCGEGVITPYILPDFGTHSISLGLGCLGLTGNTALFGLMEICQPKTGETLVVSAAAGGVGNHVAQIGKLKGCRVIGIVGSEKRAKWLVSKAGIDEAICYKSKTFKQDLKLVTPNGIDCYFDNVGGDVSAAVIQRMNENGRIAVCGCLATMNDDPMNPRKTADLNRNFIGRQLRMQGFNVWDWSDRWMHGIKENLQWINEKKIKCFETVIDGFEKCPEVLINLLRGAYKGRVVVRVNK